MLQRITISSLALFFAFTAQAQNDFKKLPSGLEYRFINDVPSKKVTEVGSTAEIHIKTSINDSVVFDSYAINNNQPVPAQLTKPTFNGDVMEGFLMMNVGDKAIFRSLVDSVFRNEGQRPPFAKLGDYISFEVEMVTLKTPDDILKENEAATAGESKAIDAYLKTNKLKATKTPSGLYYIITKKGEGENMKSGQNVSMNYTGYLLDGTVFDSNVLEKFGHVQPFNFDLGQGRVIKGWDEGIALLNKGSKAKLIIPSTLAYGSRAMPGNANNEKGIPANSILIFDVEVLGTK